MVFEFDTFSTTCKQAAQLFLNKDLKEYFTKRESDATETVLLLKASSFIRAKLVQTLLPVTEAAVRRCSSKRCP